MSKSAVVSRGIFLLILAGLLMGWIGRPMAALSASDDQKPAHHSVNLKWTASTSPDVVGYNVYRSAAANGPFKKINDSPVPKTTYTDDTVAAHTTYYYATTAVDSKGKESSYSTIQKVAVP